MGVFSIYVDGAARGNPGPAGAGIFITDDSGKSVVELSKYLGVATNNVAEYNALIFAMEEAIKRGMKDISINTDSQLLARQLGGQYKVKNANLKELHAKITGMLDSFNEVAITHIKREKNQEADRLANEAIDASTKKKKVSSSSFILKSKKQ